MALSRANVESVPYYLQDLGFKLIKMNEVNYGVWNNSATVKGVTSYLKKKPAGAYPHINIE